jgi:hypothetical protein
VRVTLNQASTTNWWTIAVFTVSNQTTGATASIAGYPVQNP